MVATRLLPLTILMVGLAGLATQTPASREDDASLSYDAPARADFPKVGGNLGNQSYTALEGITRDNLPQLGGAWLTRIEGGASSGNSQGTPVVVDGVIYIESARGNVLAVDGASGRIRWKYEQTRGDALRRGVAVGDGKVFTLGQDNWVIALDRDTGAVVWERQYDQRYGNLEKPALTFFDGRLFVGTNDGDRGAALALDARTGDLLWSFWGAPADGELGNDTWEGDSWQQGGATPWMHPAIDPDLKTVYWTFGNARGSNGPQDGSNRGGQNLFANSLVALDLDTGAYKWHFQSVHHDIWDMDNVMAPILLDREINGVPRKLVVYGSKTGMYYILDRVDGSAPLGIEERPVPQDPRQKTWPTQPYPVQGGFVENCVVDQPLGTEVPGDPSRAVPNFVNGCLFDPHWDDLVLSVPGIGGGADWSQQSYSHSTGLIYSGIGFVATAHHPSNAGGVGYRPPGEYMTGGVVAVDPTANHTVWKTYLPYEMTHGNGALTTATDLLFIGQPDGNLLALDALDGKELWRFQTGAAVTSSPAMYEVDGSQYLVTLSGGTSLPYGGSAPRGDYLWGFRIGGGLEPAATPQPPAVRRPVLGGPIPGAEVNNTVVLARTYDAGSRQVGAEESSTSSAMAPTHLVVPVGTTVTFRNPADNAHVHCATQFFEGLFNPRLAPGESFQYRFDEPGEFFFNDCHDPRPTGKIEVVTR